MTFAAASDDTRISLPYRLVVDIELKLKGSSTIVEGSGVVIGNNDILTASHVLYQPGNEIEAVTVVAGRNKTEGSDEYIYRYDGQASLDFYEVGNGDGTISADDVGRDYAVLGITEQIGRILGTASLSSDAFLGTSVTVAGYGSAVDADVLSTRVTSVTDINTSNNVLTVADEASPGHSGGPIFYADADGTHVISLVSASGGLGPRLSDQIINDITRMVSANDAIIEPSATVLAVASQTLGTDAADTLQGGEQEDSIDAGAGADRISGYAGNDTLKGGSGNDLIDGGAGSDVALYEKARGDVRVSIENDSTLVVANDGTDRLIDIERIQFNDGKLVLDVETDVAASVYRLYRASFGREPDTVGLSVNVNALEERGLSLEQLASAFLESREFESRYGSNIDTQTYVTLLYNNILSREPDEGGYAAWSSALDTQAINQSEALVGFSESTENTIAVAGALSETGIWIL